MNHSDISEKLPFLVAVRFQLHLVHGGVMTVNCIISISTP